MMRMRENDVNSCGGFGDNTEMRNVHSGVSINRIGGFGTHVFIDSARHWAWQRWDITGNEQIEF